MNFRCTIEWFVGVTYKPTGVTTINFRIFLLSPKAVFSLAPGTHWLAFRLKIPLFWTFFVDGIT
jgi:hypothetical protein